MGCHQGPLGVDIVDDVCAGREYPARRCDPHLWIPFDVANPIGTTIVRRDNDEAILKPLAWQENLTREPRPAPPCGEQDPAWGPFEVAAKEPDEQALHAAGETRYEVESSGCRFGHRRSMTYVRSGLQRPKPLWCSSGGV